MRKPTSSPRAVLAAANTPVSRVPPSMSIAAGRS